MMRWTGGGGGLTPPPRVRPPGKPLRRVAAASVLGLCGLLLAFIAHSARSRPAQGREPPYFVDHPEVNAEANDVVLYVAEGCPWCAIELDAWADAVASEGSRGPLIALSPESTVAAVAHLPEPLRARWLHDVDGSLARMMGVAAVPLLARVDIGGRVVDVAVGLSSAEERRALLRHLTQPPPAGAHP